MRRTWTSPTHGSCRHGLRRARRYGLLGAALLLASVQVAAEGMAPLAQLEGNFRLIAERAPGDEAVPDGYSTISAVYDGVALEEAAWIPVGPDTAFRIRHTLSWDPYREIYRVAALDDGTGLLDIYEGALVDGMLSVSNLSTGTFFPAADGGWTAFRLQWSNIDERGFDFEASTSADGGASWARYVRLRYERVAER